MFTISLDIEKQLSIIHKRTLIKLNFDPSIFSSSNFRWLIPPWIDDVYIVLTPASGVTIRSEHYLILDQEPIRIE